MNYSHWWKKYKISPSANKMMKKWRELPSPSVARAMLTYSLIEQWFQPDLPFVMKIAWSLRSFHAIFTPIRYAERAAQVKRKFNGCAYGAHGWDSLRARHPWRGVWFNDLKIARQAREEKWLKSLPSAGNKRIEERPPAQYWWIQEKE